MTTKLRQRQDDERREALAGIVELDIVRHLLRSGASHLDAAATWGAIEQIAARHKEQRAAFAIEEGESFADVARATNVSRQAAAKRYRHLRAV